MKTSWWVVERGVEKKQKQCGSSSLNYLARPFLESNYSSSWLQNESQHFDCSHLSHRCYTVPSSKRFNKYMWSVWSLVRFLFSLLSGRFLWMEETAVGEETFMSCYIFSLLSSSRPPFILCRKLTKAFLCTLVFFNLLKNKWKLNFLLLWGNGWRKGDVNPVELDRHTHAHKRSVTHADTCV